MRHGENRAFKAICLLLCACGGSPATYVPPDIPLASPLVTTAKVANPDGSPVSPGVVVFALPLARGELRTTERIRVVADGTELPAQTAVRSSFGDEWARHAVVAVEVASAADLALTAAASVELPAAPHLADELIGEGFALDVSFVEDGVTYAVTAADLFANTCDESLHGPLLREIRCTATPRSGEQAHSHITAVVDLRRTSDGVTRASIVLENANAYTVGPRNRTLEQVSVTGSDGIAYASESLPLFHHARALIRVSGQTVNPARILVDPTHTIASYAVPNYDRSVDISAGVTQWTTTFAESDRSSSGTGLVERYMPQTGGRSDIGLLPAWDVVALLSQSAAMQAVSEENADLTGVWPIHYRHEASILTVEDFPYSTLLGRPGDTVNPSTNQSEAFPACEGCDTADLSFDSSHQPALAYYAYLTTGDRFYLDEMQFFAAANVMQHNPYYREFEQGLVNSDQVRGQGWSLRTLGYTAAFTPDDDPLKAYFERLLANNLRWFLEHTAFGGELDNPLDVLAVPQSFVYDGNTGFAPWQDDFFTQSVGFVAGLGYADAAMYLGDKGKFAVGRFRAPGACWVLATVYSMRGLDQPGGSVVSYYEAFQSVLPPHNELLRCGGPNMAAALGVRENEMVGYSDSPIGYPSNFQPALAYAVDAEIDGSDAAWRTFTGRSVTPNYAVEPQFAIVPRRAIAE